MTWSDFEQLTPRQQHTLVMAVLLRESLEQFHVANLSQSQMKELNQAVRFGLYDAIDKLEAFQGDLALQDSFRRLVISIPRYWEIPGRDPDPRGR